MATGFSSASRREKWRDKEKSRGWFKGCWGDEIDGLSDETSMVLKFDMNYLSGTKREIS